ncbi:hypothetical protein V6N13_048060 [Hibiscus sabdariffa]
MVRRKVFSLNLVNDRQEGETIDRGSLETGRGIEWCVWCISRTLNDWWPDGEEETVADNENESGESEEDEVGHGRFMVSLPSPLIILLPASTNVSMSDHCCYSRLFGALCHLPTSVFAFCEHVTKNMASLWLAPTWLVFSLGCMLCMLFVFSADDSHAQGYRDGATNWASARVKADYQISSNEALDPNATQAPTPNGQEGTR